MPSFLMRLTQTLGQYLVDINFNLRVYKDVLHCSICYHDNAFVFGLFESECLLSDVMICS